MANKKFSEFELKTTTSNVSHIVGYNGAENVRITPANFLDTTGGPYLPLAGGTMTGNVLYQDSVQIQLGNSADLLIFHDGADSFIKDNGTGDLYIRGNDNIYIQDTSTERFITCNSNASVDLFHNDLLRLQTTSTGISVTGNVFVNRDGTNGTVASPYFENIIESGISSTNLSAIQLGNSFGQDSGTLLRFRVNSGAGSSSPINALTIDGSGNSTFAGNVKIEDTIEITDATATRGKIELNASDRDDLDIKAISLGSNMKFFTVDTERMRLDASGNLGVGTSSPTDIIDIAGAARFTSNISFNTAKAGRIYKASNHGLALQGVTGTENDFAIFTPTGALKIVIPTGTTNLVLNPANGNVGIGTSSPADKLSISSSTNQIGLDTGDIAADGTLDIGLFTNGAFIGTQSGTNASADILRFGTSGTERMRIDSGGNAIFKKPAGAYLQLSDGSAVRGSINVTTSDGLIFSTGNFIERMRLDASGNLLVGKSSANSTIIGSQIESDGQIKATVNNQSALTLNRKGSDSSIAIFQRENSQVGSISVTGSATAYNTSSDYRLKEDLQDFEGLDLVSKISVYDFKWKADKSRSYGVMAHQLQEVLPQAVTGDKDAQKMQAVDYSKIVPLLVKSIQELKAEIELLKNK